MEEQTKSCKVYVDVLVKYSKDGQVTPIAFIWEDGNRYKIDRVNRKERCASRKAGGVGIRYTIVVEGRPCYLYFEFDKWFMERRTA